MEGHGRAERPILVGEDGSASLPFVMLLGSGFLVFTGRKVLGATIGILALTMAVCSAAMDQIQEEDKQAIRYNVLTADDVVQELVDLEAALVEATRLPTHDAGTRGRTTKQEIQQLREKARVLCISGLEALAKKYSQLQRREQWVMASQKQNDSPRLNGENPQKIDSGAKHHLALICQQAVYIALRLFKNDDQVVASALSLHALVAKNPQVRQRHLFEADVYGLNLPIQCMMDAMEQAKVETNEDKEQQSAELQRKACLLLGALTDGDADVATKVVEEDGLEAILKAIDWYRYHEDVANWGLWAVFILSYENAPNKRLNVQLGCVPIVIQALRNNGTSSAEVARHGIAILFDLMRDNSQDTGNSANHDHHRHFDVWQVRKAALAAGLHEVIVNVMKTFTNTMDIMMMGQELLAGTDYSGAVPQYDPLG